ncbi:MULTISPECIES: EAL domain-containing protein [unclassified Pseudoalteromonas]|uniref:EAL domain-containing protein n=1 Tax=unclassified Pseudoalteromonas TaxID=194690 RepID=UPI0005AAE97B|nr:MULTISPECIES: EAL domain-containing protein [unclassified Pseudoalteromonas]
MALQGRLLLVFFVSIFLSFSLPGHAEALIPTIPPIDSIQNNDLSISPTSTISDELYFKHTLWGGFIGILLIMCFYNLVFYRSTKDRTFIYYSCYLLLNLIILLSEQGLTALFYSPQLIALLKNNLVLFYLNGISAILFTVNFFRMHKHNYKVWKIGVTINCILVGLLFINFYVPKIGFFLGQSIIYTSIIFILVTNYNAQYRYNRIFLMSWIPIITLDLMNLVGNYRVILHENIIYQLEPLAIIIQILLISFAFSKRYKDKELKQLYFSTHDPVTGLPNRLVLQKQLSQLQEDKKKHTLIIIKPTTYADARLSFGIRHANDYLTEVAKQLNIQLSGLDLASIDNKNGDKVNHISRFNDDSLAVILYDEITTDLIEQYAFLVNAALEGGIYLEGTYLVGNVDIGIASFPLHASNVEELQQRALQAVDFAGKSSEHWHIYQNDGSQFVQKKLKLAADLRKALMNDELSLYFQPQIELKNNNIYGCEVLLRWQHPEIGFIPPDEFIPIAESAGLINDVTEWVVEQALLHHKSILEVFPNHKTSINISGQDLTKRDLPVQVISLLAELEIDPSTLVIELTESATVSDSLDANIVLNDFKKIGVQMAIDDYGTGYSSLAYLSQLRFNEIKIDKQFVMELDQSKRDQTICKTTIEMAKSLGAFVVAEGVENENIANILQQYGCEIAQGYHFGKPMPFSDYFQWLQRYKQTVSA